jgi:hypothetical protein
MLFPAIIVSVVLYVLLSSILDSLQVFLALVLLLTVAFTIQYHARKYPRSLPFVPAITMIYGLYFAFPALTTVPLPPRYTFYSQSTRIEELVLVLAGVGLMLFGFYRLPGTVWKKMRPPFQAVQWSEERAVGVGILLGSLGLIFSVASLSSSPIGSIARSLPILNSLSIISLAILLYLYFARLLAPLASLFLALILFAQLVLDLGSGFLAPILQDLFVVGMVYFSVRKRLPWKGIILSLVVVLLLLSGKSAFRAESGFGRTSQSNPVQSAGAYLSTVRDIVSDPQNAQRNNDTFTTTVQRLDQGSLFAHVIEFTPSPVPYLYGATYAAVLYKAIPRVVWVDKPTEDAGQLFGHRYAILDPGDRTTSWNFPQIIEMYVNFGVPGVLLGMLFIGFLFQGLRTVIESDDNTVWGQLSAIIVYSTLLNVEGNFSLVFGTAAFRLLLMYLVGRLAFPDPNQNANLKRSRSSRTKLLTPPMAEASDAFKWEAGQS